MSPPCTTVTIATTSITTATTTATTTITATAFRVTPGRDLTFSTS